MGKLMTLIGDKIAQGSDVFDPLARLVNDPDVFAGNFPPRLAGALRGFVLENPDCALAKAYPPRAMGPRSDLGRSWQNDCTECRLDCNMGDGATPNKRNSPLKRNCRRRARDI